MSQVWSPSALKRDPRYLKTQTFADHVILVFLSHLVHLQASVFVSGRASMRLRLGVGARDVRAEAPVALESTAARPAAPYVIRVCDKVRARVQAAVVPELFDSLFTTLPSERALRLPTVFVLVSAPFNTIPPVCRCTEGNIDLL